MGCAIGDALGMPIEGWKREDIKKQFGRITEITAPLPDSYTGQLEKGQYTDDTILTLALAESIVAKKGLDLEDIAQKQLEAYQSAPPRLKKTFGKSTREGLLNLKKGIPPTQSGMSARPGNAPAMKMAPLGLYMYAIRGWKNGSECVKAYNFAEEIGRITHWDKRSRVSGGVQANAIESLLHGVSRQEFIDTIIYECTSYEIPPYSAGPIHREKSLYSRIIWLKENKDVSANDAHAYLKSSGFVIESYPFALFMFQKYWNNPIEGLIETVNWGGDADTTGAIYGALCGAKHGMIFPEKWIKETKNLEPLIKAAEGIYDLGKNKRLIK